MKVIFLDIDGVLNDYDFLEKSNGEILDPYKLDLLKIVVDLTDAKIVLSTSNKNWWKYNNSISICPINTKAKEITNLFEEHGLSIYSKISVVPTKATSDNREAGIIDWIYNICPEEDPVKRFVILDDEGSLFSLLDSHLIQTSNVGKKMITGKTGEHVGLSDEHIYYILNKLGVDLPESWITTCDAYLRGITSKKLSELHRKYKIFYHFYAGIEDSYIFFDESKFDKKEISDMLDYFITNCNDIEVINDKISSHILIGEDIIRVNDKIPRVIISYNQNDSRNQQLIDYLKGLESPYKIPFKVLIKSNMKIGRFNSTSSSLLIITLNRNCEFYDDRLIADAMEYSNDTIDYVINKLIENK